MKKKKQYKPIDFDKSSRRASANRKKLSKPEIYCDAILRILGIYYVHQFIVRIPYDYYIVDFYLPNNALVIEIDGLEHENKRLEDKIREDEIKKRLNVTFLRFTNQFILSHPLEVLLAIKEQLNITEERIEVMIADLMNKE